MRNPTPSHRELSASSTPVHPDVRRLRELTGEPERLFFKGRYVFGFTFSWIRSEKTPSLIFNLDGTIHDLGTGLTYKSFQHYCLSKFISLSLPQDHPDIKNAAREFYLGIFAQNYAPRSSRSKNLSEKSKVLVADNVLSENGMLVHLSWKFILQFIRLNESFIETNNCFNALVSRGISQDVVSELFAKKEVVAFGTIQKLQKLMSNFIGVADTLLILDRAGLLRKVKNGIYAPFVQSDCYWILLKRWHADPQQRFIVTARARNCDGSLFFGRAKEISLPRLIDDTQSLVSRVSLLGHAQYSASLTYMGSSIYILESPLDLFAMRSVLFEWVSNSETEEIYLHRVHCQSRILFLSTYGVSPIQKSWMQEIGEAKKIFLCFDSDAAGAKCAEKWKLSLAEKGIPYEICEFSEYLTVA